jgi:hypothetical protein
MPGKHRNKKARPLGSSWQQRQIVAKEAAFWAGPQPQTWTEALAVPRGDRKWAESFTGEQCPYAYRTPVGAACRFCCASEGSDLRRCGHCAHKSYIGSNLCARWPCRGYVAPIAKEYLRLLGFPEDVSRAGAAESGGAWRSV